MRSCWNEWEHSLVSCQAACPSSLQWSAAPELAHQSLSVTLQKPLFVAELSFLLAITKFVVPTFAFVRNSPTPFGTHDILLSGEARQGGDGCLPVHLDIRNPNKGLSPHFPLCRGAARGRG